VDTSSATRTVAPLQIVAATIAIPTTARVDIHDLTAEVASVPGLDEIAQGTVLPHSLHTTTALFVNEAEGALLENIKTLLRRLVPPDGAYAHNNPDVSRLQPRQRLEPSRGGVAQPHGAAPGRARPARPGDLAANPVLRAGRAADQPNPRPGNGRVAGTPRPGAPVGSACCSW